MAAAMVWMLAAMPLIMASPAEAAGGGGAHAHHGGDTMDMSGAAHAAGPAGWAVAVTVALCAVLLAAAGYWGARALRHDRDAGDPLTPDDASTAAEATDGAACDCADPTAAPQAAQPAPAEAAGATTALAERVGTPARPAGRLGARSDAACHAAMSVGMVVMLAAMVAGW
nr:DUF5134 domain-containing protein [Pseudonocardia sp. AL041005-10]